MRLRASWKYEPLGLRFCHHSKPITQYRQEHLLEVYDSADNLKYSEIYTSATTMHREIRELVKKWETEDDE